MPVKGVVVFSSESSRRRDGDGVSGTQRVANRAIVCHVIDALHAAGAEQVAVVAPPPKLADLRRCIGEDGASGRRLQFLVQNAGAGLAGCLLAVRSFVGDDPCFVHIGDGLTGQGLQPFAQMLAAESPDLLLLLHRSADQRARLGPATQRLLGISELNGSKSRLGLVGVCLLGPGALRLACVQLHGADGDQNLTMVAERLAANGGSLQAGFVRTWRQYGGSPLDLIELNRIVLDQQAPDGEPPEGADNRIEGRVVIDPTAEVRCSTIMGPSIIGRDARVSSSYIGPYTSIGAGAEIEGAEIERSIISDGARIMHVSGRIEGSTVGRRASIFRDFRLPRAMRLHVGEGVEVALS